MDETSAPASKLIVTRFITSFLPEILPATQSATTELTHITTVLNTLFTKMYGLHINAEVIFEAFESLAYCISVIEPRKPSMGSKPYIETNSHAIFLNVAPIAMHDMEILAAYQQNDDQSLSMESGELLLKLELFDYR
ncbi:hypothetical protein [Flavobacterium subsaxonicum]|uniref:Uncharacterized protein n=1 Tax=Flavobacterium subsaxonicum WB 4.1-42 = DSM 21790 TaxID=1121898 RepID=A0A0A2MUB7_9FLAO|nr:hypothetical protein [Flavobacterium subsaxonicum]KGO95068.1 hypothetical protein Q766_02895 [Flavobacterium subsaxonicum WB 4.1-42 = DSM 21790]